MELTRSTAFCGRGRRRRQREQMNGITAFVDASNVYGSDNETAHRLRTFSGGLLKTFGDDLLPQLPNDEDVIEFTGGDVRARENPGLSCLHTVFLREHNKIAAGLAALNPNLSDDELYNVARKIVGAEMQNIVYKQWLPEVIGSNLGDLSVDGPSHYDPSIDPSITNEFATAAFRYGHSMVESIVALHNLMDNSPQGDYRLRENFFNSKVYEEQMAAVLNGMVNQKAQTNDRHVVTDVKDTLFANVGHPGSDLIARNIQRGRDHGLPAYNEYLRQQGIPMSCNWNTPPPTMSAELWKKLSELYDHPSDVDLFTAGLAETSLPGAHVGTTFRWIIEKQFRVSLIWTTIFTTTYTYVQS